MITREQALRYHSEGRPGKLKIVPTKPTVTQVDLSMAYTPGVAEPCREIARDPEEVYKYTAKANLVAVISNGTAVLGLGNLGPLAGKPVMEGKAVLFKRFADIDVFDIEIDSEDVDEIVRTVQLISPTFGGINLEDIRAPECFAIERRLIELLDIPVFHDDQHGTAIISGAALINALLITRRDIAKTRVVFCGAGAAGIGCARLYRRHRRAAREHAAVRHARRAARRTARERHRREGGVPARDTGPHARRRAARRRRLRRRLAGGPADARDGEEHGAESRDLRHGEPGPRDQLRPPCARCATT